MDWYYRNLALIAVIVFSITFLLPGAYSKNCFLVATGIGILFGRQLIILLPYIPDYSKPTKIFQIFMSFIVSVPIIIVGLAVENLVFWLGLPFGAVILFSLPRSNETPQKNKSRNSDLKKSIAG